MNFSSTEVPITRQPPTPWHNEAMALSDPRDNELLSNVRKLRSTPDPGPAEKTMLELLEVIESGAVIGLTDVGPYIEALRIHYNDWVRLQFGPPQRFTESAPSWLAFPAEGSLAGKETEAGGVARSKKILIADDNGSIRSVLRRFLESKGYEVALACDGVATLAAVEAEKPDIVMLDINMPTMDGVEVLKQLRAAGNQTSVIMVTAVSDEAIARDAMTSGAFDYVVKPFNLERLRGILSRAIESIS